MQPILTDKETQTIERREAIAEALKQGRTYLEIQQALGVSTSTIALVSRILNERGQRWI